MEFEWDPAKAASNLRKHGVSFREAATVFGDYFAVTVSDPEHSIDEGRFITVGHSTQGRALLVAHTDREFRVRIISARVLTMREKIEYENRR